jgi:hypothetical protein
MGRGNGSKSRQGCDIAIHTEEGFGDEEASACAWSEPGQVSLGLVGLKMGIECQLCSRQAEAIKEAGVDGAVSD